MSMNLEICKRVTNAKATPNPASVDARTSSPPPLTSVFAELVDETNHSASHGDPNLFLLTWRGPILGLKELLELYRSRLTSAFLPPPLTTTPPCPSLFVSPPRGQPAP